ncbi:MAG TPA: signal peptidase II [Trebonia sp.]|jgi:signal peptidase II|nr:signal peptidase II [Trebonia sp.]
MSEPELTEPELPGQGQARAGGPGGAGKKVAILAGIAALVLALDATSKALVVANLTPGEPVHVIGDILEWNLLRNSGAAFSFGTSYTAVFTLLAIGVVAYVIRTARRLRSTGYAIAFGLLLGGASGNLADRLLRAPGVLRGNVVDWIEVTRYYPVFNLADSAICCAGALFVVLALLGYHTDGTRGDRAVPVRPAPGATETAHEAGETVEAER